MYIFLFLLILATLALYLYVQNNYHEISEYTLHIPNVQQSANESSIVFISDTHFREKVSLESIDRLLIHIENLQPDIILFGGDIIHGDTSIQTLEHIKDFFAQLGMIAPSYVIYGNHDFGTDRLHEVTAVLKRAGVTLLKNEVHWIKLDETTNAGFWLMGLSEYMSSVDIKEDLFANVELTEKNKNEPKILLAHYPHFFEKYLEDEIKRPELVLAGHAHGGQVRVPIIGGLFAPGQGTNPKYDFGLYTSENYPASRMIVTRGIGNSAFPFRVNNRPEIVHIKLN